MQQYHTLTLAVAILTISSCIENTFQQSSDRIVPIGTLIASATRALNNVGHVFLLKDSRLPDGVMFAISAYYRSPSAVRFQVWRPTNQTSVYKLVWEHPYRSPITGVRQDIYFYSANETECYHFRRDDRVGLFIEEVPAAIPCAFNTQTLTAFTSLPDPSVPFKLNDMANFDTLNLPYEFSVEAYVDTADGQYLNDTSDWVPCPKSAIPDNSPKNGATGHTGPAGHTGMPGPKGDTGPVGPVGPPGPAGSLGNDSSVPPAQPASGSSMMSIIILIWLALLTIAIIAIIIILVYFLVIKRRQDDGDNFDSEAIDPDQNANAFSVKRSKSKSPSVRDDVMWSDLKEETESTYSVHTMKETTPLSKTGAFVYEGPFESEQADNDSQLYNGQDPTTAAATLDVSTPAAQY